MARADLLINVVRAGSRGDQGLFRKSLEAMIAEERTKQHHILADRLSEFLKPNGRDVSNHPVTMDSRIHGLFTEITPQKSFNDLVLPETVLDVCKELVEEQHRRDLLRSYNLEPRHRLLLIGPPGNGKTSLAEALAEALMVPLIVLRYQGIIGSYLGETAVRLGLLLDHVRTRHCVLFFDEFDTLGKERGDIHETGEIKRVVSSLLLQMDALPSHVIVVSATNHPELLDRAVWRRFQVRVFLPTPTKAQRVKWFQKLSQQIEIPLDFSPTTMAEKIGEISFSELEEFSLDIHRRIVLSSPSGNVNHIVKERLQQWQERAKVAAKTGDKDG